MRSSLTPKLSRSCMLCRLAELRSDDEAVCRLPTVAAQRWLVTLCGESLACAATVTRLCCRPLIGLRCAADRRAPRLERTARRLG